MISILFPLLLACPQEVAPPPALPPLERALIAGVSEERAVQRVRDLVALGPRMGGTRSGRAAAEQLAKWFTEAGLEVELVEDSSTWCHESSGWRISAQASALEGEEAGPNLVLERAWPFGFSPAAQGRSPLALEPAKGAVWLKSRRARSDDGERGPVLQLLDGETTNDGSYPKAEHLRPGKSNDRAVFGISRPEGKLLRDWLAAGRGVTVNYEYETTIKKASPTTVVARIAARPSSEGGAPPGHLLFCAHGDSDSGGPGANDNGSGEAIVLEIAAAWARAIASGEAPAPARELRFAIWGKEIHSTRDYLARQTAASPTLGVINYDQAGFGSGADQLNVEPDDLPANRTLVGVLAGVLRETVGAEGFPPRWATNKSLGGTDSYVFSGSDVFRDAGRPAVTLFTSAWGSPAEHKKTPGMPGESWSDRDLVSVDYDLYYHSAGDTPENTTDREPYNMGWCARVGLLGAHRWLESTANDNEPKTPR